MSSLKKLLCIILTITMLLSVIAMSAGAAVGLPSSPILSTTDSKLSVGSYHVMAIKADGSLWAWGRNDCGQLGDGTKERRQSPVKVMENVRSVSTGENNTMAIKNDGSLWAWGYNYSGQLGVGSTEYKYEPTKILDNVSYVSTGSSHTLAIKTDGSLWGWGSNDSGELGDGTQTNRLSPVKIMDNVASVFAIDDYTLAIKKDGSLWSWGNSAYYHLGDGEEKHKSGYRATPLKILDNAKNVIPGEMRTFVIKTDGSLWGWGLNEHGQLGDGTRTNRLSPVKIMDNVVYALPVGLGPNEFSLALKSDGSLWRCGTNKEGVDAWYIYSDKTYKEIMDNVVSMFAYYSTMVLKTNGTLCAWKNVNEAYSRTEKNEFVFNPTTVMENISFIKYGKYLSVVLKTDGSLWVIDNATSLDSDPVEYKVMDDFLGANNLVNFTSNTATPTQSSVLVNGKSVAFQAYNINGNNYFKLRDLAKVLTGTGNQFDVGWDSANNSIKISLGKAYTPVGGELTTSGTSANVTASPSSANVNLYGKALNLTTYNIGGNNYFKLRDVGDAIGFNVNWVSETGTIKIATTLNRTFKQAFENKFLNYADTYTIDNHKYDVYQETVSSTMMGKLVFVDVANDKVVTDTKTIDKLKVIWLVNAKAVDSDQYHLLDTSEAFINYCNDGSILVFRYITANVLADQVGLFAGSTLMSGGNYASYFKALQQRWTSMDKSKQMSNLSGICESLVCASISASFNSSQEHYKSVKTLYNSKPNLKDYATAQKIYYNFVQATDLFNSAYLFEKQYLVDNGKLPDNLWESTKLVGLKVINSSFEGAKAILKTDLVTPESIKSFEDQYTFIAGLINDPVKLDAFMNLLSLIGNSPVDQTGNSKVELEILFRAALEKLKDEGKFSQDTIKEINSNCKAYVDFISTILESIPPYINYFESVADSAQRYLNDDYDLYNLHKSVDKNGATSYDSIELMLKLHDQWNNEYNESNYYAS